MIIGIDGNEANVEHAVGVNVYARTLLGYFQSYASKDLKFKIFLKQKPHAFIPKEQEFFDYKLILPPLLWSQFALPLALRANRGLDVFFSPAHYAPRSIKVPSVVTIHDLAYFTYPQEFLKKDLYKLMNWTRYSVQNAKRVICVSRNTAADLLKYYEVPEDKITVVYNGFEKQSQESITLPANYNLQPKKYILYVGTLQPRKNVPTLIEAFLPFHKKHPDFKLVIAGKKGWLYEEIFKKVIDVQLEEDVIFTDYVDDDTLVALYKNAFCFVMPSFYEGFGMPVLEAMSFSCPVVASDTPSLVEVGGDACLYFDPTKADELATHLEFLAGQDKVSKDLIQKGLKRIKLFSWEKCAKETLDVLKQVASEA